MTDEAMEEAPPAVWRWNADIAWHYFSSTCYACHEAKTAKDEYFHYHHKRAALYFAVGTVETQINSIYRAHLRSLGKTEEQIIQKIRNNNFELKEFFQKIGRNIQIISEEIQIYKNWRGNRNEITHPKNIDHSIYCELDKIDFESIPTTLGKMLAAFHEATQSPFPYWITGWNYVGHNGDPTHLTLLNNSNGFLHSLSHMGFHVPAWEYAGNQAWIKQNMTSVEGFLNLKLALDQYPADIEPFSPVFPVRSRLCRRWWDKPYILSKIPKV